MLREKVARNRVLARLANVPACLIGLEAGMGTRYVTRELLKSTADEYLDGADAADPRCSSVFADLRDLPPLLIQVGDDEILFDDAARIRDAAMAAGVDTTFQPWIHGIHVWPVYISAGLPESALAIDDLAAFLRAH